MSGEDEPEVRASVQPSLYTDHLLIGRSNYGGSGMGAALSDGYRAADDGSSTGGCSPVSRPSQKEYIRCMSGCSPVPSDAALPFTAIVITKLPASAVAKQTLAVKLTQHLFKQRPPSSTRSPPARAHATQAIRLSVVCPSLGLLRTNRLVTTSPATADPRLLRRVEALQNVAPLPAPSSQLPAPSSQLTHPRLLPPGTAQQTPDPPRASTAAMGCPRPVLHHVRARQTYYYGFLNNC
ncbi:hypothetical protein BDV96DRAFT_640528 [Lophiotrema nucula]|uniref:Uncharacterized protein n=1 Tax=Lophiotrema nucula TaxID=690887 RepID=A0A6A5ZNA0_9PLEO|nr:hypothetical protein BDV96DRAFT_640528 [Lophiotrema nucula]